MDQLPKKTVAVIIAHPDDEVLWAGGTILNQPLCDWFIVCLSRANDTDRALKFKKALLELKAEGIMGDMDDEPEQNPLDTNSIQQTILNLLPQKHYDLIITHNPTGEYTRHIRHEEVSKAVIHLWNKAKITTDELWTFAYEDGNKEYFPKAVTTGTINRKLSKRIWQKKYSVITDTYGFANDSWEAETTPLVEAFWKFTKPSEANNWIRNSLKKNIQTSHLQYIPY